MMTTTAAISKERAVYLKKIRRRKVNIRLCQVLILVFLLALWEVLARVGVIDAFVMSQPSRIVKTLMNASNNNLALHIGVTCYETLIGFLLGTGLGVGLAVLLWWSPFLSKVSEPYLVVLNSLPKIALGPVISLIVTVMEMLNGFLNTDKETIKMVRTFGATRWQLFSKVVFPSNLHTLFNSLKVNIGLSLVGVIAGEFLVSKAGLGYLIVYGGQVFQMDLVMTGVFILAVVAALLYQCVVLLEKWVDRRLQHTA